MLRGESDVLSWWGGWFLWVFDVCEVDALYHSCERERYIGDDFVCQSGLLQAGEGGVTLRRWESRLENGGNLCLRGR